MIQPSSQSNGNYNSSSSSYSSNNNSSAAMRSSKSFSSGISASSREIVPYVPMNGKLIFTFKARRLIEIYLYVKLKVDNWPRLWILTNKSYMSYSFWARCLKIIYIFRLVKLNFFMVPHSKRSLILEICVVKNQRAVTVGNFILLKPASRDTTLFFYFCNKFVRNFFLICVKFFFFQKVQNILEFIVTI